MFDTPEQIRNQLRAGEDGRTEFKEIRFGDRGVLPPNSEELAGELVAFANAEGGVVFLGDDDAGAARGIPPERWDAVEHWLRNVATHNCDPPIRPVVRKALLPDDEERDDRILLAEVPRGLYVHRTSGGRYYTRVGSTKRDLTPRELARLFQQRGREFVFDEQPWQATQHHHPRRHALPHLHPQPAPGQIPFEAPKQANGSGVPGVTWRRCAEDPRGRRGALGPPPRIRVVRRRASVGAVGQARAAAASATGASSSSKHQDAVTEASRTNAIRASVPGLAPTGFPWPTLTAGPRGHASCGR